jgi:uncharacterized membrane protein
LRVDYLAGILVTGRLFTMRYFSSRLILGLLLLGLGVAIILNQLGIVEVSFRQIGSYWPVIPLLLGLNWLVLSFRTATGGEGQKVFFPWSQFIGSLIIIAFGVIYLGRNLHWFKFDAGIFWSMVLALLLIMLGINLLRGRSSGGGNRFAFMGGITMGGSTPWKLDSGSYLAFMGGVDIDLTKAEIPKGETVLDLTAVMGGIEVKVPKGLSILYEGTAILGGVTYKGQEDGGIISGRKIEDIVESSCPVVRIQARAVLGGIDIKEP